MPSREAWEIMGRTTPLTKEEWAEYFQRKIEGLLEYARRASLERLEEFQCVPADEHNAFQEPLGNKAVFLGPAVPQTRGYFAVYKHTKDPQGSVSVFGLSRDGKLLDIHVELEPKETSFHLLKQVRARRVFSKEVTLVELLGIVRPYALYEGFRGALLGITGRRSRLYQEAQDELRMYFRDHELVCRMVTLEREAQKQV